MFYYTTYFRRFDIFLERERERFVNFIKEESVLVLKITSAILHAYKIFRFFDQNRLLVIDLNIDVSSRGSNMS